MSKTSLYIIYSKTNYSLVLTQLANQSSYSHLCCSMLQRIHNSTQTPTASLILWPPQAVLWPHS